MTGYIIATMVWITGAVAFWKYVLYPIAIAQVPADSTAITAFGAFWAACTILFAVYIMVMGQIATRRS